MKIFHVEFAKVGSNFSGGEKCTLEMIKFFKEEKVKNIFLTTDNAKEAYTRLGLIEDDYLQYIVINSFWTEKNLHVFLSYLLRVFMFFKLKKRILPLIDKTEDILMCHSEFFPNVISSNSLKKYFDRKVFWWFHMLAPDIFKGYEGHFTNKINFPSFAIIHYKLNQWLFFLLSKKDKFITVNEYYKALFQKKSIEENVYIVKKYSGIKNVEKIENIEEKTFDIAFMGRFHRQKGLLEIPEILNILKKEKNDIRLLLIGDGEPSLKQVLLSKIKDLGLESNVEFVGFISSDEKFSYLRKTKVFIFPSYYESFGQSALEAMANGLPVVAYDLPVFSAFKKGMIKVPILDNVAFAESVSSLISDSLLLREASKEAADYASTFSWSKTGHEVYDFIKIN